MSRTPRTHNAGSLSRALKLSHEAVRAADVLECGSARKLAARALQETRRAVGIPKYGVLHAQHDIPRSVRDWDAIKTNVRFVKRECPVRRKRR